LYRIVKQSVQIWRSSQAGPRSLHSTQPQRNHQHQTAPEDTSTTLSSAPRIVKEEDLLRAAFRDVHGARLYGFALLLAVGDRSRAATAAGAVLAGGTTRAAELRHPERAAAWLRARLLRALRRTSESRRHNTPERRAALRELGMPEAMMAALEGLSLEDRAAIVAASVERFSIIDVATILGRGVHATRRILKAARRRYLAAGAMSMGDPPAEALPGGEIAARVEQASARAIGARAAGSGA
jgi:DNA-directed RNA polymerase specialized sigma24 family protein